MKVIEAKPVTFSVARKILEDRLKVAELGYEQKIALEHLRNSPGSNIETGEAEKELASVMPDLKDHQAASLLSLFPASVDEVKVIFMKDRTQVNDEQAKKILEVLDKVRPDKVQKAEHKEQKK